MHNATNPRNSVLLEERAYQTPKSHAVEDMLKVADGKILENYELWWTYDWVEKRRLLRCF